MGDKVKKSDNDYPQKIKLSIIERAKKKVEERLKEEEKPKGTGSSKQ